MAFLKFSCKEGKPCFQHDGGSGYIETGNRLIALARDERALPADSIEVDFLNPHRRMFEVYFVPAIFPQNWTVEVEGRGIGEQERTHLTGLAAKINETIAARDEFQVADFFLYYSAAYDFQVVWAKSEGPILPAFPAEADGAPAARGIHLVYRGEVPLFAEPNGIGPVLRFLVKPALERGKTDSIDIGLFPTFEGSGKLHFAAGIKANNYGGIPVIALNQAFWSNLINTLNEAIPQKREVDLTGVVSFLEPAYQATVFSPPAEPHEGQPAPTESPAAPTPPQQEPEPIPAPVAQDAQDARAAGWKNLARFQPLLPYLYFVAAMILITLISNLLSGR